MSAVAGHMGPINACAFAPDGRAIVSASDDHTLKLWDAETRRCESTLEGHTDRVAACAFAPDGETIVSAGGYPDNTLKLWDAGSGAERATLGGHTGGVNACAFAPDGETIVSASDDNTLKLWDAGSGAEILSFPALGILQTCEFSPLGDRVCCGDGGGNVYILELTAAIVAGQRTV